LGREWAFSRLLKFLYYRKCCIISKQILHSDKFAKCPLLVAKHAHEKCKMADGRYFESNGLTDRHAI